MLPQPYGESLVEWFFRSFPLLGFLALSFPVPVFQCIADDGCNQFRPHTYGPGQYETNAQRVRPVARINVNSAFWTPWAKN